FAYFFLIFIIFRKGRQMASISNSLHNSNLYVNVFNQTKNQTTNFLTAQETMTNEEVLQAVVDYVSPIEKRGIVLDSPSYFEFENELIQKSKEINPPTKSQMQEAKEFLKREMNSIVSEIYRNNKQTIEDSIEMEKAIERGEDKKFPSGGYELLNLLKAYPYIPNNSLDNGGENLLEQIKRYVDTELSAIGTTFFNVAQDYIPKEQLKEIQDKLAIVHSYYLNGNSIEIDNKKFSYNATMDNFNQFFVTEVTSIEDLVENNADYYLLQISYTASQSIFDILNQKEKLEKENQDLKNKRAIEAYGINAITNSYTKTQRDNLLKKIIKG
ncbi:hypothetical protein HPU229336_02170, partial [Helicobacter pullorum]